MGVIYKNGTYYGGGSGGGGAEITIDNELSSTSENPVQNKVIKAELDSKQDADDLMTSADIDDVVTPLPGMASRLPRYSTEEQMVGYWIDGKPIYQKTIDCGALPNATSKQIVHGISNIDKFISIQGVALGPSENFAMPITYRNSDAAYNTSFSADNTYIILRNSQDRSMFSGYATLQYTKTTD